MGKSHNYVVLPLIALVGFALIGSGCQSTVKKPSILDLTPLVQAVNERPELASTFTDNPVPILIVVTGVKSQATDLADWWSFLGEPQDKRSAFEDSLAAYGFGESVWYTLETQEPLGVYVEQVVKRVAQSQGFVPSNDAPRKLAITLEEFWLDNTSSKVIRKANLLASVQVLDAQTQMTHYTRGVQVEASYSSDQSHAAVSLGGAVMASFIGIGPSGEGMRKKADAEAAAAAIKEVLTKLQDELASDPELWNAMR